MKGSRTAGGAENVSRPITGLKKVKNNQAFPWEEKTSSHFFFRNEPLSGARGYVCTQFRANIRRTDCVGPLLSHT